MAQDQKKSPVGGNKPKPDPAGAKAGQSAKDRSRAQSRPVTGKAPTGKSGKATGANKNGSGTGNKGGGGGNKPRPGTRPAPAPAPRRISGTMMAWGAVGLVVVIIVVLVIVKATSTTSNAYTPVTPAPATVVHDVTNIPLSVYNQVGVTSPTVPVNPPTIVKGQPPLTFDGKTPGVLFYGAEYCPFCAAERWSLTAALSRFGTWSGLKITASSHTDTDPETHTFSYHGATFTSPYLAVKTVEAVSNVPNGSGYYNPLETPTKYELADVTKYEGPKYIPGSNGQIGFPFISINNLALVSGPSYDPGVLAGQTWSSIASGLSNPTNPATQAIVTTANYMTAAICASTKGAPASVCATPGVEAAAKALKLS
ncbi:MAG TPA: DUF929 family protein [Acidimicrobiales bacterium]|nr:DUF929 family protein [Acidimicrobiales bacterium]